jgi:nucleoside-diphosphate-sugar epimerase
LKVLVTGAGGFLGGRLVESLLRHGRNEIRLHFRGTPDMRSIQRLSQYGPTDCLEAGTANLLHPAKLNDLMAGVDLIIHAAAAKRGAVADMFQNTVIGTRNLLDAAVAAGCRRIVLVSSFAVFQTADLPVGMQLDERCATEATGVEKGGYGFVKVQQELLFREYQQRHRFEYVVLRPGVIYGPGDSGISARVGLQIGSMFFSLGGRCLLPLTYVENCADAIVMAALGAPSGSLFSVVDDDLPTCDGYLSLHREHVGDLRKVSVPHWALTLGVRLMTEYHRRSLGQLPAILNSHLVRSMYRRLEYSNAALKQIGWTQRISTHDAMLRTFAAWREARRSKVA